MGLQSACTRISVCSSSPPSYCHSQMRISRVSFSMKEKWRAKSLARAYQSTPSTKRKPIVHSEGILQETLKVHHALQGKTPVRCHTTVQIRFATMVQVRFDHRTPFLVRSTSLCFGLYQDVGLKC